MTHIIKQRYDESSPTFDFGLKKKLPEVRGRLTANAPLKHMTWLRVGGPAEVLFKPQDKEDLIDFVKKCPPEIPITVLGVVSNVIIRDGGIPGVVIRMGREFAHVTVENALVTAGVGALDMNVALTCLEHKVTGLEFLSGIPGTIGGGLRMNAGAYGKEIKDVLVFAEVLFRDGTVKHMTADEMSMRYRHNDLPQDVIFMSAIFKGQKGSRGAIEKNMQDIKDRRSESQPIKSKTGGSTFANPSQDDPEIIHKSWELIDAAGCRGLKVGDAQMSEMHCNFMINTAEASAADLERLGEEVRRRVFENSNVMLRWEVKRMGMPLPTDKDILEFIKRDT